MIKDSWTEADLRSLPSGEHDEFERKSGQLLDKPDFREDLAKALSAFANSGGGHIVIGVENDGSIGGVSRYLKGRQSTREWLEQIIPNLLDYSLEGFRIHEVELGSSTAIPSDKVVIVIDVGDSPLAPHQTKSQKIYYQRVGSHSKPAPHFYLELLRNRLATPKLNVELVGIRLDDILAVNNALFVRTTLQFNVTNFGRIAAYHWAVIIDEIANRLKDWEADYLLDRRQFPGMSSRGGINLDRTILPSLSYREEKDFGFYLRAEQLFGRDFHPAGQHVPQRGLGWEARPVLSLILPDVLTISYRAVSESNPGQKVESLLGRYIDEAFQRRFNERVVSLFGRGT